MDQEASEIYHEQNPTALKRRKLDHEQRSPLKEVTNNARKYAFFESVSDDEDEELEYVHKPTAPRPILDDLPKPPTENDESNSTGWLSTDKESHPTPYSSPTAEPRGLSSIIIQTFTGRSIFVGERRATKSVSYERIVAAKSTTEEGRATKSYYGIDIHDLMTDLSNQKAIAEAQAAEEHLIDATPKPAQSIEKSPQASKKKRRASLWCDRYRAHKFTDLVGDERTHRSVLHWLKKWDSIVFPGSRQKKKFAQKSNQDETIHRKVLILAGPPGLGKTTLAHVCAKQAGYEVHEINGSDERTAKVVKERISEMLGTENVRGINSTTSGGTSRKVKPQCVVVDEVDGVVGGSGRDEAGFVKALLELVQLDQKNSSLTAGSAGRQGRKKFRMLRPLILICNDLYHPSLRSLRHNSSVEILHMRKPPINTVVSRVHSIFEREGVPTDEDGIRRLCEATWGVSTRKDQRGSSGTAVGDIRSVLVVGEWVATKFRQTLHSNPRLTKTWIEENIIGELAYGGGAARSLGRGSTKEVVDRVFQEDAGFLKSESIMTESRTSASSVSGVKGVTEAAKRRTMSRLNELIYTSGDFDRIVTGKKNPVLAYQIRKLMKTDCFTSYPIHQFQDDNYLTKPNAANEWLHFYDRLNSLLTSSQEWEIAPYLSSPVLGFHHLFAQSSASRAFSAPTEQEPGEENANPFIGLGAPYAASESLKANTTSIQALQLSLSHSLARTYRSRSAMATELLPYLLRLLAPDVKPVVIHTSSAGNHSGSSGPIATVRRAEEKDRVARAAECMAATGVRFERSRVEGADGSSGGWVYRMEPSLDALGTFSGFKPSGPAEGVRFAVRQVLESEWRRRGEKVPSYVSAVKEKKKDEAPEARENKLKDVKRDFFGRVIKEAPKANVDETAAQKQTQSSEGRVWVSFHEGFSNAVRRPITLAELMSGL
jgi:chromosome transmission fidelity protein 18